LNNINSPTEDPKNIAEPKAHLNHLGTNPSLFSSFFEGGFNFFSFSAAAFFSLSSLL